MLEKLNQKPESYRRRVAFFATCLAGLFIVTVWAIITQEKMSRTLDNLFPQNKENALGEEDANFEKVLEKALEENAEFPTEAQKKQIPEQEETEKDERNYSENQTSKEAKESLSNENATVFDDAKEKTGTASEIEENTEEEPKN